MIEKKEPIKSMAKIFKQYSKDMVDVVEETRHKAYETGCQAKNDRVLRELYLRVTAEHKEYISVDALTAIIEDMMYSEEGL